MEAKQKELDDANKEEAKLLQEASERKQQHNNTGDTPPPLPPGPPPDATPSGAARLDALIGAPPKTSGAGKKVSFGNPETPEKKASFDDNANERKLSRLEQAEKDPNVNKPLHHFKNINNYFPAFQAFISEAESLLNSSSMALERFDFNKSTGHTPSVIGAQEVYR